MYVPRVLSVDELCHETAQNLLRNTGSAKKPTGEPHRHIAATVGANKAAEHAALERSDVTHSHPLSGGLRLGPIARVAICS